MGIGLSTEEFGNNMSKLPGKLSNEINKCKHDFSQTCSVILHSALDSCRKAMGAK